MRAGRGTSGSERTPLLRPPFDQDVVQAALDLAGQAHRGQLRADGTDYIAHPIRVARLAAAAGAGDSTDQDVVVGALLHDVVEDSDTPISVIEQRFGARVAGIVDAVSAGKPPVGEIVHQRRDRKLAKLERLRPADTPTLLVHGCDVLDNAISWRYLQPHDPAWAKIPRWMFQLRDYQLDLVGKHYPEIAAELVEELRFEESRGHQLGSWATP
jgi:(p)ppGpp synthase/HD superfamily hydrolase